MEHGAPAASAIGVPASPNGRHRARWRTHRQGLCQGRTSREGTAPLAALVCAAVLACYAPGLTVGFVDDMISICSSPEDDEVVTVNYACAQGSHLLPLSLEYGFDRGLCNGQFQGAAPATQRCINVTSENVTTACVSQQRCTVLLPSWITCDNVSWKVNYVRRMYTCVKGETWYDACARPASASYSSVSLFVFFGSSSPQSCTCNVSLLSPANAVAMEVLREPDSSMARLAASQTSTTPSATTTVVAVLATAAAHESAAYRTETRDDVTTSADDAVSTLSVGDGASTDPLDKCVTVTIASATPTRTSREAVISYSGAVSCRSKYTMVYSLRVDAAGSAAQWIVGCSIGQEDASAVSGEVTTRAHFMTDLASSYRPSTTEATVASSTSASQSTVALAAGLTGGLVGAAIAGTVLATVLMRLRREKLPRRSVGSDVRRPMSSRKASRQQSTMVISESDYNSRDHDGAADHYYELPAIYSGNGDVPAAPARPTLPSPAQDYANGYIEALRDDSASGSRPALTTPPSGGVVDGAPAAGGPVEQQQQQAAAAADSTGRYETPVAFGGSLPNAYCYESLKREPSTQL